MLGRQLLLSIFSCILVIAVSVVYCGSNGFFIDRSEFWNYLCLALLIPLLTIRLNRPNIHPSWSLRVLCFFFALVIAICIALCKNYFYHYYWPPCFASTKAIALLLIQGLTYGIVFYQILLGTFLWLDTCPMGEKRKSLDLRKWFWLNIAVRCVFLAAFFPCLFDFDAALGLRTFLDENSVVCNHHPVFVQAIHAVFFSIGSWLGNPSWGFFLLSILAILTSSAIVVYALHLLNKAGLSGRWLPGAAVCLTFFPLFPYLSLAVTKDGFFAYALLLYVLSLYELHLSQGHCLKEWRFFFVHSVAILFVCLTRQQGLAIVAIESIYLLLCRHQLWKSLAIVLSPSIIGVMLITRVLYPYCNVEPGGKQELYGTLFQQTAYYLSIHSDDITEKESAAINAIFDQEKMVKNYRDYITDPVKNDYRYNPRYLETREGPRSFHHIDYEYESQDLKAYLTAWASMGLRHPFTYLQASASIFLGFFYNNNVALLDIYTPGADVPMATTPKYKFWRFDTIADYYYNNRTLLAKAPVIGWFCAIPYYIWASIVLLALLFYRKDWKGVSVFLPVILSLGVLLICPVVSGRYALPIVVILPLLLLYTIMSNHQNRNSLLS